jgi:hypothetical protein
VKHENVANIGSTYSINIQGGVVRVNSMASATGLA